MEEKGIGTAALVLVAVVAVAVVGVAITLQGSGGPAGRSITVKGSTTVLPIAQAAAEAWMNEHPNDGIIVEGGGSGTGIQALIDGTIDIANASRPIKSEEVSSAEAAGVNPVNHNIAVDAVSIVVNPNNSVDSLTLDQAKEIFAGDITNWSEVGGSNQEIVVFHRESGSGTRETFEKKVMSNEEVIPGAITANSNGEMRQDISQNPSGIGYVGLGYVDESVQAVSLDGVEPSEQTAASGDYPIVRYLHMYTNGQATGLENDFIEYILSSEGQEIVEQQGFIKLSSA